MRTVKIEDGCVIIRQDGKVKWASKRFVHEKDLIYNYKKAISYEGNK